ncbi:MAG: efflux RND transporter permease subunit [Runella sp.]
MPRFSYQWLLGFLVLSVVGALLASRLSVQLSATQSRGNVVVTVAWPGASPEAVERLVVSRIEGAMSTVQGVAKVSSVSRYNGGSITLELDKKAKIDQLRFEVATLLRQLYPQFPKEVAYPTVSLNDPGQQAQEKPLITLQLNGAASASTLQRYAEEQLAPRLAQVEGVYAVQAYGGNRTEYVVRYDLSRLQAFGLTEQDILIALQNHYTSRTLGIARLDNGHEIRITSPAAPSPPLRREEFSPPSLHKEGSGVGFNLHGEGLIIKRTADRIVYLRDVATVSREEQPATNFYRINGQNAINLVITSATGANQLEVADKVKSTLTYIRHTFPASYQVRIEYDATEFIRDNLRQIAIQSGLAVLMLLLFVALTSQSWRYTLLILVSMVVNLLLAAILFYVFRVEIHLYSLAALTTSLGLIIDNVVVMIDHYRRYRHLKVFMALLGATLTTCAGLVVLWFLPDEIRYDLWDFALVMMCTLGVSLAVALWFIPSAMEQWGMMRPADLRTLSRRRLRLMAAFGRGYGWLLRGLLRYRKIAVLAAVLVFGLPVFMLPNKLDTPNPIASYYNATFGSEWYNDHAKPIIDKWLGGTLRLFVNYVYEGASFSKPERTTLYVNASLPNQSTIEQMDNVLRRMEQYVGQYVEVDRFITHVYNGQQGGMTIYFKPSHEKIVFPYLLKNRLIAFSTEMSGISWDIYGVGQGFSQNLGENETPTFTVVMRGYNYDELSRQAGALKERLEKHPRIQQVNTNRSPNFWGTKSLYEYIFQTDAPRTALQGLYNAQLYTQLADQNARPDADWYGFVNGQYEPIKVIPHQAAQLDLWQLNQQPFRQDSAVYRLGQLGSIVRERVTPEIHKENQEYIRLVSFEYFGSAHFGSKFLTKTLEEFRPQLPMGYTAQRQDYNWWSEEARKQYELIGLVMLLIYVICAIIFESLRQPFALIMMIPLSFVGVFLAFYAFDFNFDQGGYASFVLLSGNVVNAGIFLIAEYNTLRQRYLHKPPLKAYLQAFQHKIVPILLALLSTVLGLMPFLIYGQNTVFWFALAVGTIGGSLMSLVVLFLYLPLFLLDKENRPNLKI